MRAEVSHRAGDRCEYCQMHQAMQGATFHVEHIVPECQGGRNDFENLAWSCPSCNLHKASRLVAADEVTGHSVRLFNPRSDSWEEHFSWNGYLIIGLSAIGRATVAALRFNDERRVRIRRVEELVGLFPPT